MKLIFLLIIAFLDLFSLKGLIYDKTEVIRNSLHQSRDLGFSQKYLTSDCVNGCFNGTTSQSVAYYCENPDKVGYCCPKGNTEKVCQ